MQNSVVQDEAKQGGCLCGAIRFAITQPIAPATYCHCTDCRKMTGSAFGVSFPANLKDLRLLSGTPGLYTTTSQGGTEITRNFCRDCGSPLFTTSERHPGRVFIKAGALDDPEGIEPGLEIWRASKVSWATIPPDIESHQGDRPQGSFASPKPPRT